MVHAQLEESLCIANLAEDFAELLADGMSAFNSKCLLFVMFLNSLVSISKSFFSILFAHISSKVLPLTRHSSLTLSVELHLLLCIVSILVQILAIWLMLLLSFVLLLV